MLRTSDELMGVRGLSEANQRKVDLGNASLSFTIAIIRLCRKHGIPVGLENPRTSILWLAPPLLPLLRASDCRHHHFDQCAFGTPWRKPTTIALWGGGLCDRLTCRCGGSKGICGHTGVPHVVLAGRDPGAPARRTALAATYPRKLCDVIADHLISFCQGLESSERFRKARELAA